MLMVFSCSLTVVACRWILAIALQESAYTLRCLQSSVKDSVSTGGRLADSASWTQGLRTASAVVDVSPLNDHRVGPLCRVVTCLAENAYVSTPCARSLLLTADIRRPAFVAAFDYRWRPSLTTIFAARCPSSLSDTFSCCRAASTPDVPGLC